MMGNIAATPSRYFNFREKLGSLFKDNDPEAWTLRRRFDGAKKSGGASTNNGYIKLIHAQIYTGILSNEKEVQGCR